MITKHLECGHEHDNSACPVCLSLKLDAMQRERDNALEIATTHANERNEARSRLGAALVFVDYIAKRYEEGWNEPITERFYNEAVALLNPVVETSAPKSDACPLCGRTDAHSHTSGPFGMS